MQQCADIYLLQSYSSPDQTTFEGSSCTSVMTYTRCIG